MRRLLAIVILTAAVSTSAGCAWVSHLGEDPSFEDEYVERTAVTQVRITGDDGGVSLVRGTGPDTRIHRKVWYRGHAPTERTSHVDGKALVLDTNCGPRCSVTYTVTVPAEVAVTGELGSGPIDVRGVSTVSVASQDGAITVRNASGDVTVRTGTGPITLAGVTGAVAAHTTDGAIQTTDVRGAISAETRTGPIDVSGAAGEVTARTVDGAIRLTKVAGKVTAQTTTGPIDGDNLSGTKTSARTVDGAIRLILSSVQDVDAHTSTGPVTLTVRPAPEGYRIQTVARTGPTTVDVPNNPAAGHLLNVATTDGAIMITSA